MSEEIREVDCSKVGDLVRKHFAETGVEFGEFKPVAYYDKNLDRIFVFFKDTSVCENEPDGYITLFEDNYVENNKPKFVGFSVDCVSSLAKECEFNLYGNRLLTDILDKFFAGRLLSSSPLVLDYFKLAFGDAIGDLSVDF